MIQLSGSSPPKVGKSEGYFSLGMPNVSEILSKSIRFTRLPFVKPYELCLFWDALAAEFFPLYMLPDLRSNTARIGSSHDVFPDLGGPVNTILGRFHGHRPCRSSWYSISRNNTLSASSGKLLRSDSSYLNIEGSVKERADRKSELARKEIHTEIRRIVLTL